MFGLSLVQLSTHGKCRQVRDLVLCWGRPSSGQRRPSKKGEDLSAHGGGQPRALHKEPPALAFPSAGFMRAPEPKPINCITAAAAAAFSDGPSSSTNSTRNGPSPGYHFKAQKNALPRKRAGPSTAERRPHGRPKSPWAAKEPMGGQRAHGRPKTPWAAKEPMGGQRPHGRPKSPWAAKDPMGGQSPKSPWAAKDPMGGERAGRVAVAAAAHSQPAHRA
jgi:hypothetical protein